MQIMNSNAASMNFKDRTGRFIKLFALIVAVIFCASAQQSARPPAAYPPLPDWISIQRDIHYDRYPATILDVLQPKKRAAAKAPAVVVFHGGGWIHSGKETAYTSLCRPYLQRGFVVFNVEYRVASQATAPAAVTDALDATHWVFQHASIQYRSQENCDHRRLSRRTSCAHGRHDAEVRAPRSDRSRRCHHRWLRHHRRGRIAQRTPSSGMGK